MDEQRFKDRTKWVSLEVIRLVKDLPRNQVAEVLGGQLLRAATSIGANYRAACRGRSTADVLAKLGIVEEEADETLYWMELLTESAISTAPRLEPLVSEVSQILAMTVASKKTIRQRLHRTSPARP